MEAVGRTIEPEGSVYDDLAALQGLRATATTADNRAQIERDAANQQEHQAAKPSPINPAVDAETLDAPPARPHVRQRIGAGVTNLVSARLMPILMPTD